MTFSIKEGEVVNKSKYISTYKKEDERWKIFRDCFNADLSLSETK